MLMNILSQCPKNSEDLELTLRPLAQTCVCGGTSSDQDSHLRMNLSADLDGEHNQVVGAEQGGAPVYETQQGT